MFNEIDGIICLILEGVFYVYFFIVGLIGKIIVVGIVIDGDEVFVIVLFEEKNVVVVFGVVFGFLLNFCVSYVILDEVFKEVCICIQDFCVVLI